MFLTCSTWQGRLCLSQSPSPIFKGKLYGRGATDNKGPVLAWINAVSAFRALEEVGNQLCLGGDVVGIGHYDHDDDDDKDDHGSEGDSVDDDDHYDDGDDDSAGGGDGEDGNDEDGDWQQ